MRYFIVFCMAAVVCADKLGYKYKPVGHSSSGLSFKPGALKDGLSSYPSSSNYGLPAKLGDTSSKPVHQNNPVNFGGYQTEFYSFTAPEDIFDDTATIEKITGSLKKKIRVIFIKTPENNVYESAVLALAKHAVEQKTAIYVLNKQHDVSDLVQKFNVENHNYNSKPEVHFVKYRTHDDAINAQRTIQSKYDSLDASTKAYNDGAAPVHNLVSQAAELSYGSIQTPDSVYLPFSVFYRI